MTSGKSSCPQASQRASSCQSWIGRTGRRPSEIASLSPSSSAMRQKMFGGPRALYVSSLL